MAHGTLANLSTSAFIRTPPRFAEWIVHHLLTFPTGEAVTVLDPTAGEGDLLVPCLAYAAARLYGVEISADRAEVARQRLPQANILTSAFEGTTCTPRSMSLVLANPPYFFSNGKRAEYRIIADAGELLMPGGIMVAIIPARSAWDGTMISHWCKWYDQVRVWKFPDRTEEGEEGGFEDFTQICVVGVRLASPRVPDTAQKKRLSGFRWRKPEKLGQSPWDQGFPPPDLPTELLPVPYVVPAAHILPALVIKHADVDTLLQAVAKYGAHLTPAWESATTWSEEGFVDAPAMPPTGEAHLAADILTGLLDGEIVCGPDGTSHLFTSFVTQEWVSIEIDEEEREKQRERGVVHLEVKQQQDKPILRVLNLASGSTHYYQGDEVFTYLQPWLPTMAARVIEKRKPLYQLDPQDWEIRVVSPIGKDKQLPSAAFPGLAVAQHHRVYAMSRAIDAKGRTAIQGEPGVGKTRIGIATVARLAYRWRHRNAAEFRNVAQPAWVKQVRRSWLSNPTTRALLGVEPVYDEQSGQVIAYRHTCTNRVIAPEQLGPSALPVLVTTPKKVTKEWANEIRAAWPQAEVLFIKDYHDVTHWMQRCATSSAPAVIGIFSHSTSRAFGRAWQPVVHERMQTTTVPDLEPDDALKEELEAVFDRRHRLVAYQFKETGQVLTKDISTSFFYCPDCLGRIEATPRGVNTSEKKANTSSTDALGDEDDADVLEPVTSLTWFKSKQRWCNCEIETREVDGGIRLCNAPLWTDARTETMQQKYPRVSFADWSQAMQVLTTGKATMKSGAVSHATEATFPQKIAQGTRLMLSETGPIAMIRPDMSTVEGYEPVQDAEGSIIAYRHSISGHELVPLYGLRSRRIVGYVAAETGELVTKTTRYELRTPPPSSFSPYEYLHRFYKGCVALAIIDESHNGRGRSTDIAHSFHLAKLASQARMYASGTHYGGTLDDFFYYWFRFSPQFWQRLGLGWNDVEKAISRYGVVQVWTREYESDARRGSGRTDVQVSTIPAPGISARIIPPLLEDLCYLTVLDVGAHMPPRIEIPEVVSMRDPALDQAVREAEQARMGAERELADMQKAHRKALEEPGIHDERDRLATECAEAETEAQEHLNEARRHEAEVKAWAEERNLSQHYLKLVRRLDDLARERNNAARLAKGTIPRWFATLPCESAFEVTQTDRDDWGDVIGKRLLVRTPVLAADYLYPLEKRLREIVQQEVSEGRRVMVYLEQNDIRSMSKRLEWVLKEHVPWALPNNVEAEDRQEAILSAVASGRHVVLVPYRRVNEGLNLQRGIDTVIWFEMPMNLFMLDQASRRAWRLGKQEEVRIFYMVYAGTAGHYKLRKLGSQSGAAAAFAGEPARGALIEHAGADKTTLARLSHSLESMDEEEGLFFTQPEDETEALKAAFARRGEELQQALKRGRQWIGVVDTLPERLAALHAEKATVTSQPIRAGANGHRVIEAEMLEVTRDASNEVISSTEEESTATTVLELQPIGSDLVTDSSNADSSIRTTDGEELFTISVSSTPVNGTNGNNGHGGTRPTWDTLLQLLETEKAGKATSRSRKKLPEKAASTTQTNNLWEITQEGGKSCNTTLNTTKAEELMPETTSVSQASLW
jgi:Uncharacterised methyltransferase family (DUF6094)/Helicase conserved C-terminal domain